MEIKRIDDSRLEAWDEYVRNHPDSSPYHLSAWQAAIERAYSHHPFSLMAFEGGQVMGVAPLVGIKIPLHGGTLVGLPYCDAGQALCNSGQVRRQLYEHALDLVRRMNFRGIEVRGGGCEGCWTQEGYGPEFLGGKVRMLLDLPPSSELLWDSFKSKLRSQVRKAEKNGLLFQWGAVAELGDFYAVFSRNMRDLGSPVHSRKWFESIFIQYGKEARLGLVYKDRRPVAAGIILQAGSQVAVPWASTLREYNRLGSNMLLYWNFLKYAADSGMTRFDFGRSSEGEGTYDFKSQWGARPAPLDWWKMAVRGQAASPCRSGKNGYRKAAEAFWRRFPLVLANSLGPRLRKYISL